MRIQIISLKNLFCTGLLLVGIQAAAQESIIINNESKINSAFQEYSPAFFSNGLVFVASNPSVNTAKKEDSETGKSTTSIFFVTKDENGSLQNPVAFAEELTTKYYDGPLSFSADGNTIYFTRSHLKKGKPVKSKDGSVKLKIYSALRMNNKWENITEMPFNSSDFDCAHPSVSQDGRRLYFASNRSDGFGGWDIYVSTLINGKWSDPVNLGPKVNTAKNEVFPFIHPDGKVYFSSNGRSEGIGNLDIFYTLKTDTGWLKPHLLPEPVNSRSDDFGIIVSKDKKNGYFSSNRASGKGDDDIFSFTSPLEVDQMIQLSNTEDVADVIPDKTAEITATASVNSDQVKVNNLADSSPPAPNAATTTTQAATNTSEFSEPKVATIPSQPEAKKEDSALPTIETVKPKPEDTKTQVAIIAQPEVKKEDSALPTIETVKPKPEATKTEVAVMTQPEAKKEDSALPTTETPKSKPEATKTEVAFTSEPVFDETIVSETPTKIETPSDKPLKKLSEPKVELSKTEFTEAEVSAIAAQQMSTSDKPETTKDKLVDTSVQSFISPANPVITRRTNKGKKQDEHNAALIVKEDAVTAAQQTSTSDKPKTNALTETLATSSQIKSKYLVVVGTYSLQENAVIQKKIAVKKGFTDTEIIKYEDNNLYGVCVRHFNDEKDAQLLARSIHKDLKMDAFVKVLK